MSSEYTGRVPSINAQEEQIEALIGEARNTADGLQKHIAQLELRAQEIQAQLDKKIEKAEIRARTFFPEDLDKILTNFILQSSLPDIKRLLYYFIIIEICYLK